MVVRAWRVAPSQIEVESGEKRLNKLGYKEELQREMVRTLSFTSYISTLQIGFVLLCMSYFCQRELGTCGLHPLVFSDEI